ncbi:copper resistance protein CopB [Sphingobium yanoikuyae]|jgi:copper resistance protein B|uniref:copper resistance protein B n=1 Tax=Sphingobium TaxID=165695 RepID=UPI0007A7521D|nr:MULTISPECIES: copper resistance protein B [Sphingobium]KZC78023.1 copper resistance protein CopB [Sphingobium yanoikuyae]TKV42829.1 copper resistance protein CopB [Sphingobium sp. MP9-4]
MKRLASLLSASAMIALALPADAQDHSMHDMQGMRMPSAKPTAKPKSKTKPKPKPATPAPRRSQPVTKPASAAPAKPATATSGHQDHDMSGMAMPMGPAQPAPAQDNGAMPGMGMPADHAGHEMAAMSSGEPVGTDLPAGSAPAPTPPMDHYADLQFPPADMAHARDMMMRESGGQTMATVMFNLAEYQARKGRDGYRWDGEAWLGGDINRLTIKSEGEGVLRQGVEAAEVQALYSRAIGPYFNLQAGVRHDFKPSPSRTYAVIGFEGLAPYWFEVEGAAFLSDKGDLLGRLEGYYDQRITQRLVLQPRAELNLSAQDVPESRIGAGLSSAELGLRLRYEITRQFAPYIGVSYEAKTGQTARYVRGNGDDPTTTSVVAGVRIWF